MLERKEKMKEEIHDEHEKKDEESLS